MEHVSRDISEGIFPTRSERRRVPTSPPAAAGEAERLTKENAILHENQVIHANKRAEYLDRAEKAEAERDASLARVVELEAQRDRALLSSRNGYSDGYVDGVNAAVWVYEDVVGDDALVMVVDHMRALTGEPPRSTLRASHDGTHNAALEKAALAAHRAVMAHEGVKRWTVEDLAGYVFDAVLALRRGGGDG